MTCPKDSTGDIVRIPREGRRVLGELLSKKLLRDKRGDVSLSGSQHFAAGAPRGEHGNTTLPSASSRRVSLPFTQFPAHLGGPFRYSFDTKTHSRQGISPSARRLIAGLLLTQSPAPPGGPFDALPRPRRRATPALADVQPRPRRRVAPPSPRPRSFHAGQERCRCPFSERFSLLSRLS